jgi:cytochrome bd ubiquinol oxidase subunit II
MHTYAYYVFHRLVTSALPLVIVSVVAGTAALVLVLLRRVWLLRIFAAIAVCAVVAAWGFAQYPYLFPTSLSLREGSAPPVTLDAELVVTGMAAVFVLPAFVYLYWLQQHEQLVVTEASGELLRSVAEENRRPTEVPRRYRVVEAVIVGTAAWELTRTAVTRARQLGRGRRRRSRSR